MAEFLSLATTGGKKGAKSTFSLKSVTKRFPDAVKIEETEIDMVFLIDNSSSMYNIIEDVITASKGCVTKVVDKGAFCAYTFTHENPEVKVVSTRVNVGNVVAVQDELGNLANCDGGTALYDAIEFLFMKVAKYRKNHKVPQSTMTCFLIFTDGEDQHSERCKSFKQLFDTMAQYKKFPVRVGLIDWSANPQNLDAMPSKPGYFKHFKKGGSEGTIGDFITKCFDYLITVNKKSLQRLVQPCLPPVPQATVISSTKAKPVLISATPAFDPRSRTANSHVLCYYRDKPHHDQMNCCYNHRFMCKFGKKCNRHYCRFAHFETRKEQQQFCTSCR